MTKQEQAIHIWMQTGLNDDNKYKGSSTDARSVATMRQQQQRVSNYGNQATFFGQPLGVQKEDEKRRSRPKKQRTRSFRRPKKPTS